MPEGFDPEIFARTFGGGAGGGGVRMGRGAGGFGDAAGGVDMGDIFASLFGDSMGRGGGGGGEPPGSGAVAGRGKRAAATSRGQWT